ncbi:hypothetical protein ACOMHN_014246 [Nucella lapillus]
MEEAQIDNVSLQTRASWKAGQLDKDLASLLKDGQLFHLMESIYFFRKNALKTNYHFSKTTIKDEINRVRRAKKKNPDVETNLNYGVRSLEDIWKDILVQVESFNEDDSCTDDTCVGTALSRMNQFVYYTITEEIFWTLTRLKFLTTFSLLQKEGTLDQFPDVQRILVRLYLDRLVVYEIVEMENQDTKRREEETEEYSLTLLLGL